jgi:N12 class adenine-specific DNA methylase
MYKVQELIMKGLQVEKLPSLIQDDISTLKTITKDFTIEDLDGHDFDDVIYEVIITSHKDLLPAESIEAQEQAHKETAPEATEDPEKSKSEKNILIGDKYFQEHPEKVLGKQTIGGRYGNAIIVTGDKKSLEIDVPVVQKVFEKFTGETSVSTERKENIIAEADKIIERRKTEKKSKPRAPKKQISQEPSVDPEFYTFREISDFYNINISRQELESYLYANPILPWNKYIDEFQYKKEDLIKEGYLFSENNQLHYKWVYLSGDINKKITYAKRDEAIIRDLYGDAVFENQIKLLHDEMPKQAQINIDPNAPGKITLSPISEFAKTFRLKDEEIAFVKNKRGNELTLNQMFIYYLQTMQSDEPEVFKGSEYRHVRAYVNEERILVKQAGSDASNEEKKLAEKANMTARQKAKTIAENLFDRFMFEELYSETKMRLEILWNERYNAFKLPELSKIPVGFSMSKFIKNSYLKLNITQRESVAFINYNRSGCLALEVGLGKTISAITCISQAVENNMAKKPLIVSPKNVYWKWQKEIEGYYDDELKMQMVGVLHHYPKVLMLGNCNEKSVIKAKTYTEEETREINKAFENIALANEQIKVILKYQTVNDDLFVSSNNPLSDIARDAYGMAKLYVSDKINSLKNKYHTQIDRNISNPPVYEKLIKQLEVLITKEREKIYDTFGRIYRKMVQQTYSYLIYMTGQFNNSEKGTITIVTEEALKNNKLGCRDSEMIIKRMYGILSGGDDVRDGSGPSMVDKAALYEKIKARVDAQLGNSKVALEDLGIDLIVIDEAHHAKKIFASLVGQVKKDESGKIEETIKTSKSGEESLSVKREALSYSLGSGETSGTAMSAFILATYIQETTQTGNVILLTATPFENDPLEIYSMLTLSNYQALVKLGYESMKEFFDTFMKIEYDYRVKINGVEKAMVLNGFQNLIQFRNIVRSIILHRTGEQANIERPDKIIIPYINRGLLPKSVKEVRAMLMPTAEQTELIKKIEMFIEGSISLTDLQLEASEKYMIEQTIQEQESLERESREEDTGEESEGEAVLEGAKPAVHENVIDVTLQTESEQKGTRIIQAFSLIRQITLSPYALKLMKDSKIKVTANELIESSPKLEFIMACIKSVKEYHEKNGTEISGQIIYSVVGKDFFQLIRQYLIEKIGYKPDQIAIIHGGVSDNDKELRKKQFYDGIIKVLIASKSIQVGADLNKNSTVLYHLFYDWNPTDNEQINGRIWRQGNRYGSIRIVYPMVENSVDPVTYQYLGEKTTRIKDVWDISGVKSQLDLSEFDPNKLKLAALTDPHKKAKFQVELERETIQDEISLLQAKLEKVAEIPATIKQFHYYQYEAVKHLKVFFTCLKNYDLKELANKRAQDVENIIDQKTDILKPVQELIDKRDEEISKFNVIIQEAEASKISLEEIVKETLVEIKAKLTDAVLDNNEELIKSLRTQFKDAEKNLKASKEKELNKKIDEMNKSITKIQNNYQAKIDPLQKKLDDKIKELDERINRIEATYNKNVAEISKDASEKTSKIENAGLHETFTAYLTFLSFNATYTIKWCRDSEARGKFSDEMSEVYTHRTYFIGDLEQFKNYKGQYEKIKLAYLTPMGIAEEDASNLPMAIRNELEAKHEELENIGEKYKSLVIQYTAEYNERLLNAKTPAQEAEGFATLNFLLDELNDTQVVPEPEIVVPIPAKPEEKPTEIDTIIDPDYIKDKIMIFEMAMDIADEETKIYLETKIDFFKEALNIFKKQGKKVRIKQAKSSVISEVEKFAKGGKIGDNASVMSYIDMVTEDLMTPGEFVTFMRKKGLYILPNDVFKQIEDITSYDKMIEIFEFNEII